MFKNWDTADLQDAYYNDAIRMIEKLRAGNIPAAETLAANVEMMKIEIGKRGICLYPIDVCMGVGADLGNPFAGVEGE